MHTKREDLLHVVTNAHGKITIHGHLDMRGITRKSSVQKQRIDIYSTHKHPASAHYGSDGTYYKLKNTY
jgi:polyisoprenoid-binding protein YceI